jgi:hypothetical protein
MCSSCQEDIQCISYGVILHEIINHALYLKKPFVIVKEDCRYDARLAKKLVHWDPKTSTTRLGVSAYATAGEIQLEAEAGDILHTVIC